VDEHGRIGAAGIFQGAGQDREPGGLRRPSWQDAVVIGGLSKLQGKRLPGGVDGRGP
jgi:hypothetical protein